MSVEIDDLDLKIPNGATAIFVDTAFMQSHWRPKKSRKRTTVSAETKCLEWLTDRMGAEGPDITKAQWLDRAVVKFPDLSKQGFCRVWKKLPEDLNAGKPGRKPKSSKSSGQ